MLIKRLRKKKMESIRANLRRIIQEEFDTFHPTRSIDRMVDRICSEVIGIAASQKPPTVPDKEVS